MNETELEESVFELVGYMLVSAQKLLEEPQLYGPFRVVDAASRLIAIMEDRALASPRLSAMREKIDAGKYSLIGDAKGFEQFLDSLVDVLVDHMICRED